MSRIRPAVTLLLLAASMACGSSPPSTFYTLAPQIGGARAVTPVHVIRLRRPGIGAYLDRPEIVRSVAGFRVGLSDGDRWAAPLDEMLGRVLAQDLEQRLSGSVVLTHDGAITADADATVEVDVRSLDATAEGEVGLTAEVALERGRTHAPAGATTVRLKEKAVTATTDSLVSAMSDLVGKLADEIAMLVQRSIAQPSSSVPASAPRVQAGATALEWLQRPSE